MTQDASLPQAEERCREAQTREALSFIIANETWQLVPYRQALVWRERDGAPALETVSGLAGLSEDSPFTVWARRLARALWPALGYQALLFDLSDFDAGDGREAPAAHGLTADIVHGWEEWWPAHLLVMPLMRKGERLGAVLFLFEEPPEADELAALGRLQATWSYCAWALGRKRESRFSWKRPAKKTRWIALAAACAVLLLPVRQSALAPAEIVALKSIAVAAPVEGVIKAFHVQPNQQVKAGAPLFSLDDTTLRNRREVTARALEVAAAELLTAQQKAFDDPKARGEVATLQGRIAERRAELQAVEEQLGRINVNAGRDGIAVFGDINDWQGRPVVTGERVMQLADAQDAGVLVYLPVADAIELGVGAPIRLFLHTAPLSPLEATLRETSYQSVLSPDGVASYRLRGVIAAADKSQARIGLKGTAKVSGQRVPLIYYVLRRPLAVIRQWSGL